MEKILVISDVHGRLRDLRWVLKNEPADAVFFLGDGLYDLDQALELQKPPLLGGLPPPRQARCGDGAGEGRRSG